MGTVVRAESSAVYPFTKNASRVDADVIRSVWEEFEHDLRNPLNRINLYLASLARIKPDLEELRDVAAVEDEIDEIVRLVSYTGEWLRTGKLPLRKKFFQLDDLIQRCVGKLV